MSLTKEDEKLIERMMDKQIRGERAIRKRLGEIDVQSCFGPVRSTVPYSAMPADVYETYKKDRDAQVRGIECELKSQKVDIEKGSYALPENEEVILRTRSGEKIKGYRVGDKYYNQNGDVIELEIVEWKAL